MTEMANKSKIYIPNSKDNVIPFMRDVFTIPRSAREKPRLIGSVCRECEEYFFPKTGAKATCDNPFCPRSTSETYLSGRGQILSATVTRSAVGEDARVSAVILLEEGIKVNSVILGWEGFEDMLVPGTPVEMVLQEMEKSEDGKTVVGYAFHLMTGRRKPKPQSTSLTAKFLDSGKGSESALSSMEARKLATEKKKEERVRVAAEKKAVVEKKRAAAAKEKGAALAKKKKMMAAKKAAAAKKKALDGKKNKAAQAKKKKMMAAKKKVLLAKKTAAAKKKSASRAKPKAPRASGPSVKKKAPRKKTASRVKAKAKNTSRKKSSNNPRRQKR
ncbi:MAG: hypothetical protein O2807_05465 [bacterium]|nr:hypothetical protein [bacterium]